MMRNIRLNSHQLKETFKQFEQVVCVHNSSTLPWIPTTAGASPSVPLSAHRTTLFSQLPAQTVVRRTCDVLSRFAHFNTFSLSLSLQVHEIPYFKNAVNPGYFHENEVYTLLVLPSRETTLPLHTFSIFLTLGLLRPSQTDQTSHKTNGDKNFGIRTIWWSQTSFSNVWQCHHFFVF